MTRLFACLGTTLCLLAGMTLGPTAPTAIAVPAAGVSQPAGSVPVPAGPAEAWVLADMDTGEILAGRNEHAAYAPASTIKVLTALTVLDELPLDATVVANEADTRVECNCAGVTPGMTYTARQLLEAMLLVSGNDAANTLATMLGGREAVLDAVVDVGLAHPAAHRLDRHTEIGGHLREGQVPSAGDRDHISLELGRELLGHRNILPARHRRAETMSTEPASDP